MSKTYSLFKRRASRTRHRLRAGAGERPRLCVFRSSKNIYAQIIYDTAGKTIASASSVEEAAKKDFPKGTDKKVAAHVGKLIAERAIKAGVKHVVFDRGGYIFHGRIKALADAAREGGLNF